MARVFVAIGSNLGDRAAHVYEGVAGCVRHGLRLTALSRIYETDPVGGPAGQENYFNAVAAFESGFEPALVFRILQQIETACHRSREVRFGPRTLDLDLLLFGDKVLPAGDLILPHPRLHERLFVLLPLAELAPNVIVPGLQKTVSELLQARLTVETQGSVRVYQTFQEKGTQN